MGEKEDVKKRIIRDMLTPPDGAAGTRKQEI